MKDIVFKTIMLKGEAGGTIVSIEKTGSTLNVDTYTITLNDGETHDFEVTNGTTIASIEKTSTSGLVDTYTITLTDGTTFDFRVTNGQDAYYYELPKDSVVYFDSEDPTPQGYETTNNPNGADINYLKDKLGLIWIHDDGTNRVFMSGELDAVGTWIISQFDNINFNKWIGARIAPTDSSGYFGSSSFSLLANCSSANYGTALLISDNPNVSPIVVGQLIAGTWHWIGTSEGTVMQMAWGAPPYTLGAGQYQELQGVVEMAGYTDGFTAKGILYVNIIYPSGGFVCTCGSKVFEENGQVKALVGFYNPNNYDVPIQVQWRILYFKN